MVIKIIWKPDKYFFIFHFIYYFSYIWEVVFLDSSGIVQMLNLRINKLSYCLILVQKSYWVRLENRDKIEEVFAMNQEAKDCTQKIDPTLRKACVNFLFVLEHDIRFIYTEYQCLLNFSLIILV